MKIDVKTTEAQESLDLIWGAERIAQEVNLNVRQTFYALEKGSIPAKKVGGKWVAERGRLREFFLETEEA